MHLIPNFEPFLTQSITIPSRSVVKLLLSIEIHLFDYFSSAHSDLSHSSAVFYRLYNRICNWNGFYNLKFKNFSVYPALWELCKTMLVLLFFAVTL